MLPWAQGAFEALIGEDASHENAARALVGAAAQGLMVVDDEFDEGVESVARPDSGSGSRVDTRLLDEARKLMEADADDNVVEFPMGRIT